MPLNNKLVNKIKEIKRYYGTDENENNDQNLRSKAKTDLRGKFTATQI